MPQEVWSGINPSFNSLRTFGIISYAHLPHQGRAKLEGRTVKLSQSKNGCDGTILYH